MLFQTSDVRALQKLCKKNKLEVQEVNLAHIIVVDDKCVLAPESAEHYQAEYDARRVKIWQSIENSPRFFTSLHTTERRRDYASEHPVEYASHARFSMTNLEVVVVEISSKKLISIDYQRYNRGLKDFLTQHPDIFVTSFETVAYA